MPLFISSPGCASGPDMVEITPTLISVCAAAMPIPASDAPSSAMMKRDVMCMLTPLPFDKRVVYRDDVILESR